MSCALPDAHGPCSPGVQAATDRLLEFKALDELETDDAARLVRMATVVGLRPAYCSADPLPKPDFQDILDGTIPSPEYVAFFHPESGIRVVFYLDTDKQVYKATVLCVDAMLIQLDTREVGFKQAGSEDQIFPIHPCDCVFKDVTVVKVTQGMRDLYAAHGRMTYLPPSAASTLAEASA